MSSYLISGAGSGIGKATAVLLSRAGHTVYLLGRNQERLNETIALLNGKGHRTLVADIRDRGSLAAAYESIKTISLDGIIAAAGVGGWSIWGENDKWSEIVNTNLSGTYNLVNTFYPLVKVSDSRYRHIILVTSSMARIGMPNFQALSASKAGLHGLARSWAVQWANENILVNSICPGWVDTDMASDAIQNIANAFNMSAEEAYRVCMDQVPLKKMSQPEDIAAVVAFLLSQTTMTGSVVDINGGFVMAN